MTHTIEKVYFYEINQQTQGPVNTEALIELIESGKLTYGNSIWCEGFPDWIKVEHSEFKEYISEPPPLTRQTVTPPALKSATNNQVHSASNEFNPNLISNVWVWLLAVSPFIVMLIASALIFSQCDGDEWCVGMRLRLGNDFFVSTIALLVLNIAFSLFDENNLKKAGVNTKEMSHLGAWLVPVYLYQRATYLKHNIAYFIVWLICFVLFLLVLSGVI